MAIHEIGLAVADLGVPRWPPCTAAVNRIMGMDVLCMATPTAEYIRDCGTDGHTDRVWLCPIHAAMCVSQMAVCRQCLERGGVSFVKLTRVTAPLRVP